MSQIRKISFEENHRVLGFKGVFFGIFFSTEYLYFVFIRTSGKTCGVKIKVNLLKYFKRFIFVYGLITRKKYDF